ncbi:MAG: hypothetical protein JXR70_14285 [Spirochaetales bacterium]|nr:hypothetical protein [Spirochaetales bacterium]
MIKKNKIIWLIMMVALLLAFCSKNKNNETTGSPSINPDETKRREEIQTDPESIVSETVSDKDFNENKELPRNTDQTGIQPLLDTMKKNIAIVDGSVQSDSNTQSPEKVNENSGALEIQEVTNIKKEAITQNTSRQNQDFLPHSKAQSVYPEDYLIGSLYNPAESSLENKSIAQRTMDFLNQLKKYELSENALKSASIVKIRSLLSSILDKQIELLSYRIGSITTNDTASRVNIRLWSKLATVEGELYLSKAENNWYIEDIQVDIMDLAFKKEKKDEAFMPSSYVFQ